MLVCYNCVLVIMQSVSAAEEYCTDTISVFFFKISLEKGLFQSVRSQIDSYSSMRSSFTKILFFSYLNLTLNRLIQQISCVCV